MKGAGSDIDNELPPPIPSLKPQTVVYKPAKYLFQERKKACSCVQSFFLPRLNEDLCISVCPIGQVLHKYVNQLRILTQQTYCN